MANKELRTWVEISRSAVSNNVQAYKNILPPEMSIMAVVKSNAYGHGLSPMVKILEDQVQHFSVVFIEEAMQLRDLGVQKPILVFSTVIFDQELIAEAIRRDISFTIYDRESYQRISAVAEAIKKTASVHINMDTGMSRLGFSDESCPVDVVCRNKSLRVDGLYTHLSSADSDPTYTREQCERFKKVLKDTESMNHIIPYKHILNTPAAMLGIDIGNVARLGLGLFGLSPGDTALAEAKKLDSDFNIQPALSFKTRVIQVRQVKKGTSIGYGRTYQAERDITEAIVPIGFADGYNRALSNRGEMLIKGVRCPVLGRICMNNIMLDVTEVPNVAVGDEVVIIGESEGETITAHDIAQKLDTVATEIVTVIPDHLPRIYQG